MKKKIGERKQTTRRKTEAPTVMITPSAHSLNNVAVMLNYSASRVNTWSTCDASFEGVKLAGSRDPDICSNVILGVSLWVGEMNIYLVG